MVTKTRLKKEQQVCDLYVSGLSSNQIAEKTNLSSSGIRLILKRNNIQLRNKSEANLINEDVRRKDKHYNWNGGKSFHRGQVYINLNRKRVKESHYNWCIANGMLNIPHGMIIHHIDENPLNNQPSNLVLLDQSLHIKLHRKSDDLKFKRYMNMERNNTRWLQS